MTTCNPVEKNTPFLSKDIAFPSAGATLAGRLFVPANHDAPWPVLVLSCGIGGRKEWFEPVFPQEICSRNMALFLFDLRGHRPSSGTMDADIDQDLPAAINAVKQETTIDATRIIIGGQCLGALLGISFAASRPDIKGVVNISSFLPKNIAGSFNRKISDAVMMQIEDSETHSAVIDNEGFFKGFAQHLKVLTDIESIAPRPVLFVHYHKDPVCPASRVTELFHRLNNPNKELHLLDNDHTTWISDRPHAMSYDDLEVAQKVGQWIEKNF